MKCAISPPRNWFPSTAPAAAAVPAAPPPRPIAAAAARARAARARSARVPSPRRSPSRRARRASAAADPASAGLTVSQRPGGYGRPAFFNGDEMKRSASQLARGETPPPAAAPEPLVYLLGQPHLHD